ncbi:hypothetical protein RRG08_052673 [Elysia crispata]|uniref:Uncharacterized protein n=1 Tax=Elysia crispata TaxID=231223 RepID=A0AAE1AQ96_9GAST|nr:hypothetical protein RRG08_052673 [Elysia crispata]
MLHRLPEHLPPRPQHRHQLLGDTCPGPPNLAQQARDWCSCSRDSMHHRGSGKACLMQGPSHLRFNYHYPLVPYLRTSLQRSDWTC